MPAHPQWTILADDLTGACDTGAAFAAAGWPTRVLLQPSAECGMARVCVLTSESRAMEEAQAVRAVEQVLSGLKDHTGQFYKKIDSTLRGHPAAELAAVLRLLSLNRAVGTPAFPAQGRTVTGGQLRVNGQVWLDDRDQPLKLAQVFDRWSPTRWLPIQTITLEDICQGVEPLAQRLSAPGLYLADAETEGDLNGLAQAGLLAKVPLFFGSAGLARSLAAVSCPPAPPPADTAERGTILVVAGTRHPATTRQVEALITSGAEVRRLIPGDLRTASQHRLMHQTGANLDRQIHPILLMLDRADYAQGRELEMAELLAQFAVEILASQVHCAGMILTGGDTAAAVCRVSGSTAIDLGGEVEPGICWGALVGGRFSGLRVITKSGGFGDAGALLRAVEFLTV